MDEEQIQRILAIGKQELAGIRPDTDDSRHWAEYLGAYSPHAEYPGDAAVWLTCVLALEAVATGNFGVGCVLTDSRNDVVAYGHNEVFSPQFHSDRHAEMVVMSAFENTNPTLANLSGYTLFTSLESCPMCLSRLINSGVGRVLFAAPDHEGGMVHKLADLPPLPIELSRGQTFGQAKCSPELITIAQRIWFLNDKELNERLRARRASAPPKHRRDE